VMGGTVHQSDGRSSGFGGEKSFGDQIAVLGVFSEGWSTDRAVVDPDADEKHHQPSPKSDSWSFSDMGMNTNKRRI